MIRHWFQSLFWFAVAAACGAALGFGAGYVIGVLDGTLRR